jgi:hypothetical protein
MGLANKSNDDNISKLPPKSKKPDIFDKKGVLKPIGKSDNKLTLEEEEESQVEQEN